MRKANAHKSWPRLAVKHSKARQRAFAEVRRILALADRAEAAGMHGEAIKLAGRAKRLYAAAQKSGRLEGPVGVLPNPEARPFFCSLCDSELKADAKQLPSGRWACGKCQKELKARASEKSQARLFEEQQGLFNPARCANVPGFKDELGQFHPIRKGKGYVSFLTTDVASPEEKAERKQKRDSLKMAEYVSKSRAQTAEQFKRKHKSLSQFVRGQGGIAYKERQRGSKGSDLKSKHGFATELGMLSPKETGTTGLLNKRNRQGSQHYSAEYMMDAANVEGYRDRNGEKFSHIGDFISAVADDASGVRKFYTLEDLSEQGEAMSNPHRKIVKIVGDWRLAGKGLAYATEPAGYYVYLDTETGEGEGADLVDMQKVGGPFPTWGMAWSHARKIAKREGAQIKNPSPPLNEWDTDEDEAFALGDKAARMLGHSRREARKGLKLYKGGYYSKLKDRHVEFIMPIEAHSAAEAKAQVKAMVTNEKPVNVTAREVKRNPKRKIKGAGRGYETSAYAVAASKGYPYIRGNGEVDENGYTWLSRFTKTYDGKGPALYVGWDEKRKRWIIREGNPSEQHIDAGHVTIVNPVITVGRQRYQVHSDMTPEDHEREGRHNIAKIMRSRGMVRDIYATKEKGSQAFTFYQFADGHFSKPVRLPGLRLNPTVSEKISQLRHEGYPHKQAVAIAFSEKRAGKVNPEGDCANCPHATWQHARQGDPRLKEGKHVVGDCYVKGCRCPGYKAAQRASNPWACLECGKTFRSAAAAEKAAFGDEGCPNCGGSDIDNVSEAELKQIKGEKPVNTFEQFYHATRKRNTSVSEWGANVHIMESAIRKAIARAKQGGTIAMSDRNLKQILRSSDYTGLSVRDRAAFDRVFDEALHNVKMKLAGSGSRFEIYKHGEKATFDNPGLIDLAATMQAADYLKKTVSGRKRNPTAGRFTKVSDSRLLQVANRLYKTGRYGNLQTALQREKLADELATAFGWTVDVSFKRAQGIVKIVARGKRKHNPSVTALSKTFQGKASGKVDEYKASNAAPSNLARIGKLVLFVVNGKTVRIPGAMVAADTREKLWIVNAQFTKRARSGQRLDYGPITRIIYETVKAHIEPGKRIEYDHAFEQPLPHLQVDAEGCPIIAGGGYKIKREGITG